MSYRHHHHLLSHLIVQHHRDSEFSFSESFSSDKAFSRVRQDARSGVVADLERQLAQARELFSQMRDRMDSQQYQSVAARIESLEEKIKEKKDLM